MDYQAALDYLNSFGRFGSRPGLERMEWVLERLGHPERQMKFIHIGGTNGKGSTTAFVHSILQIAGYRVGMYTSPYLESFTNRIGISGRDISPEQLVELVSELEPLFEEVNRSAIGPITHFEVTTLLAIVYYKKIGVDFVAWEVGLGGRLDATNVVTPLVSIITNIGMDHAEVLGDSLVKIAAEKAGIVKPNVPLVTAVEDEEPWAVIRDYADIKLAPTTRLGQQFGYRRVQHSLNEQTFDYNDSHGQLMGLSIALLGEHQCKNAATAVAAVRVLEQQGYSVSEHAIREGLKNTRWPGRLEIMGQKPLVVVDGAHNPHGTKVLEQAILDYFQGKRIVMVLGILKDKERQEMLSHLLPHAARVIFTAPNYGRAAEPSDLLRDAAPYNISASTTTNVAEAIELGLQEVGPDDLLLVAGSLYTVSEAREVLKRVLA